MSSTPRSPLPPPLPPLRFVSHQLTSSHAAYHSGSSSGSSHHHHHTRTVPTSHPAFEHSPAASSSSTAASHPEHAVHATAQYLPNDQGTPPALIVARAVEEGCTLQVSVLPIDGSDRDSNPHLFLFPAPLLPSVHIFVDAEDTRRLYILAVTTTGWLYRLAFPLPQGIHASTYPYDWATEHSIQALAAYAPQTSSPARNAAAVIAPVTTDFGPRTPTMVHAAQPGLAVVACRDGTLIKMEQAGGAEGRLKDYHAGPWRESCLRPSSFFKNISKLFSRSAHPSPAVASLPSESSSSPTHVASLATPRDDAAAAHTPASGLAFCLSRDRKLRIWNLHTGNNLRTIDLPTGLIDPRGEGEPQSPASSSSSSALPPLGIEGPTRPLIATFTPPQQDDGQEYSHAYDLYLVAFVPAPLRSGSFFAFYGVELLDAPSGSQGDASVGEVALLWQKRCDDETRGLRAELRDVAVLATGPAGDGDGDHWTLWSLWDAGGKSMVKYVGVDLDEEDAIDADADAEPPAHAEPHAHADAPRTSWTTVEHSPSLTYTALHGADLDLALASSATDDIPPTFLARIFEAGRYSSASLEWALDTYAASLRATLDAARLPIPPALQEGSTFLSLAEQIATTVGSGLVLETDPQTGALAHEQFRSDLRREWRRFVGLLDEVDAQGRWPVGLVVSNDNTTLTTPLVMMRDRIVALTGEDAADTTHRLATAAAEARVGVGKQASTLLPERVTSAVIHTIGGRVSDTALARPCWELIQTAGALAHGLADHQLAAMVADGDRIASQPLEADVLELAAGLWEDRLQEHLGEGVAESVTARLAAIEAAALEPALWALADLLVSATSGATAHTLPTQLTASFVADGSYKTLRARLCLARTLTALVLFIFAAQSGSGASPRLPYLVVRFLSVQHQLSVLVQIANRPGVRELAPDGDTAAAAAIDDVEDPQEAVTAQLKRLTVGPGPGSVDARGLERPGASLLHFAVLNGLLVCGEAPDSPYWSVLSSAVASVLGGLGLEAVHTPAPAELPTLPLPLLLLAHRVLARGFPTAALHIVESYPPNPASSYVVARAQLQLPQQPGAPERAAEAFEAVLPGLLQMFARSDAGDRHDDAAALCHILPAALRSVNTEPALVARYYRHVVDIFEKAGADAQIAHFSRLALQTARRTAADDDVVAPALDDATLRDLSFKLFRSELSLRRYASCYATMMDMDDVDALLRRDCLRTLISVMCESGSVDELLSYSFSGLQAEVERNLSFKARNSDPTAPGPNYYEILYSYHMRRGDYTSAGAVMYQQAHRLAQIQRACSGHAAQHRHYGLSAAAEAFRDLSIQQARSYLASMNALALLDSKNAWFADAVAGAASDDHDGDGDGGEVLGRKHAPAAAARPAHGQSKLTRYIPASYWQFPSACAKQQLRIIQSEDIRREYHLVLARLELVGMYPELASGSSSLSPSDAVALFVRQDQFERAFGTARALGVDQCGVFTALALRCAATSLVEEERRRARAERDRQADPDGTNEEVNRMLEVLGGDVDAEGGGGGGGGGSGSGNGGRDDEDDDDDAGSGAWSFLRTCERTASWNGSPSALAWRYLKLNLEISDAAPGAGTGGDAAYHRTVVLERLLTLDAGGGGEVGDAGTGGSSKSRRVAIPPWLTSWFHTHAPESLVRCYLRAGLIDDALRSALDWVRSANAQLSSITDSSTIASVAASQTSGAGGNPPASQQHLSGAAPPPPPPPPAGRFIPYTLVDTLVRTASDPDLRPARGSASASATRSLAEELKSEVVNRRVKVLERKWREGRGWAEERARRAGGAGEGTEWDG